MTKTHQAQKHPQQIPNQPSIRYANKTPNLHPKSEMAPWQEDPVCNRQTCIPNYQPQDPLQEEEKCHQLSKDQTRKEALE